MGPIMSRTDCPAVAANDDAEVLDVDHLDCVYVAVIHQAIQAEIDILTKRLLMTVG